MRLTFSRAIPAIAATSLWLSFWRMRMRPCPTSWPNASARSSNARATRPLSGRKLLGEGGESAAADEGQLGIAQGGNRGRAREPVDGGQLADDAARPDDGEN